MPSRAHSAIRFAVLLIASSAVACGGIAEDTPERVFERNGATAGPNEGGEEPSPDGDRDREPTGNEPPAPVPELCSRACDESELCDGETVADCEEECFLSMLQAEESGCLDEFLDELLCEVAISCDFRQEECAGEATVLSICLTGEEVPDSPPPNDELTVLCRDACEHQASCGGESEPCAEDCVRVAENAILRDCGEHLRQVAECILGHPSCGPPEGWCEVEEDSYYSCVFDL